ncbi:MAG: hypothetical protein ACE5IR_28780 [bacterium]
MNQLHYLFYGFLGLLLCGETLFARELTLTGSKLSEEKSTAVLQVDIKNTGARSLFPVVWADLYNQENRYVGRFRSDRKKIAPGASHLFSIAFDTLQAGTYSALVVGHYLSNDPSEDITDTVSLLGNIRSFNLPSMEKREKR